MLSPVLSLPSKVVAALVAVALLGAAPVQPVATRILELEQARTLGGGELAAFLGSANEDVAVRAALAIGRSKQVAGVRLLAEHLAAGILGAPSPLPRGMAALVDPGRFALRAARKGRPRPRTRA